MNNFQQGIPATVPLGTNVATKAIIPGEVALTGTISSVGKLVTGVGTLFTTQLLYTPNVLKYKYIWDAAGNRLMEIDYVISDTKLWLKVSPPGGNISSQALIVPDSGKAYRAVNIEGGVTVSAPNQIAVVYAAAYEQREMDGGLAPIAIVGTGSTKISLTL